MDYLKAALAATPKRTANGKAPLVPDEQLEELALAWVRGEVRDVAATAAVGGHPNNVTQRFGRILRRMVIAGKLELTRKG